MMLVQKLVPYREQGETGADRSKLVRGRFNKRRNFLMRLVFGVCTPSRTPDPGVRILKDSMEAFAVFIHTHCPAGHHTLLPHGCVLENGSGCGMAEGTAAPRNAHSKSGEGMSGPRIARV